MNLNSDIEMYISDIISGVKRVAANISNDVTVGTPLRVDKNFEFFKNHGVNLGSKHILLNNFIDFAVEDKDSEMTFKWVTKNYKTSLQVALLDKLSGDTITIIEDNAVIKSKDGHEKSFNLNDGENKSIKEIILAIFKKAGSELSQNIFKLECDYKDESNLIKEQKFNEQNGLVSDVLASIKETQKEIYTEDVLFDKFQFLASKIRELNSMGVDADSGLSLKWVKEGKKNKDYGFDVDLNHELSLSKLYDIYSPHNIAHLSTSGEPVALKYFSMETENYKISLNKSGYGVKLDVEVKSNGLSITRVDGIYTQMGDFTSNEQKIELEKKYKVIIDDALGELNKKLEKTEYIILSDVEAEKVKLGLFQTIKEKEELKKEAERKEKESVTDLSIENVLKRIENTFKINKPDVSNKNNSNSPKNV